MVFSLRQLQEKCREQKRPLFLVFIDLTNAFDMVSRTGLFTLLERIGCPPKLLGMIRSFHDDMNGTVQYDGSSSDPYPIKNGVKQGCVLAPTLFGIFSLLLRHAFCESEDGIFLHTRSDGNLFNLARLRTKTKVRRVLIKEWGVGKLPGCYQIEASLSADPVPGDPNPNGGSQRHGNH